MTKCKDGNRASGIGGIAKKLRGLDQVLADTFLEDFSVWWEEDGETRFFNWKNPDFREEKSEEPKDNIVDVTEGKTENSRELINEKDAASYIGMSRAFLRQARCNGQIGNRTPGPPYYKIGRAVRYSIEDLDRWLEENKFQCL